MEIILNNEFFQLELVKQLDVKDMYVISTLNKSFYNLLKDDTLWKYKAYNDYGNKFWEDKVIENYQKELTKMEKFQIVLEKITMKRWSSSDFNNCWHRCSVLRSIFNVS